MTDRYQLTQSAAEMYERQKVRAIFRPLAAATLDRVAVARSDSVLDAGCGTGILSRMIVERGLEPVRLTGVDLNESMLDVARRHTEDAGAIRWCRSDVANLPFAAGGFTLCFCQQTLQFLPNKQLALTEFRRVLAAGGRLAFTVWRDASPLFLALAASLDRHLGADLAQKALAPFAFQDTAMIETMVAAAGFNTPSVSTITLERRMENGEQSIRDEIAGSAVAAEVSQQDDGLLNEIVSEVAAELASYRSGRGFTVPQTTNLLRAECR